jgi:sugar transferase (PEP-CTERM/EpsH1 system associated)
MRILVLAPRICWPLDTGAKLRNYHLSRVLAERASVTFMAFSENGTTANGVPNFCEQAITVPRDPGYTYAKILRGGVGPTPLPMLNYTTERMKRALTQLLCERDFDIVQLESVHLIQYLPIIRAARHRPLIICDWHNIESELMRRYSQQQANPWRKAYSRATARKLQASEWRALKEFDAHISVSARDAKQLCERDRDAPVFVIENGVDPAYYSDHQLELAHATWKANGNPPSAPTRDSRPGCTRDRILFVGSMDYHANIDAVVTFAREVWPLVREQQPQLIFTIVGRDPAREVCALAAVPGIEVTGKVDDVRPYYREAIAAVVPLRVGGGSRLKIPEAMAAGVPVISTTLGAEGLDVSHDENILIADESRELKAAIVRLAETAELRQTLQAGGRALVSKRYDWGRLGANLVQVHDGLLKSRRSRQFDVPKKKEHRTPSTPATIKLVALVEATSVNAVARNLFDFHRTALELRRESLDFPFVQLSLVTFARRRQPSRSSETAELQTSTDDFVSSARQLGLEVDVIPERRRFDSRVIPALRKIVAQRAPDVVLTHAVKSHLLLWRSGLWRQFPWVAFHHGYTTTDRKMRLYNQLDRWSLPRAHRVITVCKAFAQDLCDTKGLARDRIFVQHNSIRPEPLVNTEKGRSLRERLGVRDDERVIIGVGRLSREKAHVDLIAAFNELRNIQPDISARLIIVGDGPERQELEAFARLLGIADRVIFTGHVSNVQPYYAIADVLANASHSEGSPYVLLEAMANGVPVVATNVGGVPEILNDEESALLVPPQSPQLFANALRRIMMDAGVASRLSTNAKAHVAANFSPESYVRSLMRIYQELENSEVMKC